MYDWSLTFQMLGAQVWCHRESQSHDHHNSFQFAKLMGTLVEKSQVIPVSVLGFLALALHPQRHNLIVSCSTMSSIPQPPAIYAWSVLSLPAAHSFRHPRASYLGLQLLPLHFGIIMAIGSAGFVVAEWCSHLISHVTTGLLTDGNPNPNYHHNWNTIWYFSS